MIHWTCDRPDCEGFSFEGCRECQRHLCAEHIILLDHHMCLNLDQVARRKLMLSKIAENEINFALSIEKMDIAAAAQKLCGHSKVIPIGPIDVATLPQGGMNVHVEVGFEVGTTWMARIPKMSLYSPPDEYQYMVVKSTICTLQMLKKMGVLVPAVHVPLDEGEARTDFFFLDKVPGHPCSAPFTQEPRKIPIDDPSIVDTILSDKQLRTLLISYAKIAIGISETTFIGIGSLHPSASGPIIGPMITDEFHSSSSPLYFLGPFQTNSERYLAFINRTLSENSDGEGQIKIGSEGIYYTHLWLRQVVEELEELKVIEPTYSMHGDDKGDHVMVDGNFQVTGIIDWDMSYTTSKAEAFSSPHALFDMSLYFEEGDNSLSRALIMLAEVYDNLDRPDLGNCVRGGRLYHRLGHTIGLQPDLIHLHPLQEIVGQERGKEISVEEWVEGLRVS